MIDWNLSQKLTSENIEKPRNHFIKEIDQNGLMSQKHKEICTILNYIEHFLVLASAVTSSVSVSAFVSLLGISVGITRSVVGLRIWAMIQWYNEFLQ